MNENHCNNIPLNSELRHINKLYSLQLNKR